MLKALKKIVSKTFDIQRVQDNIAEAINPILATPLLDGVLLTNVLVTNTAKEVDHKLGRLPIGWVVTDKDGSDSPYRVMWSERSITLRASTSVTCSIWVF